MGDIRIRMDLHPIRWAATYRTAYAVQIKAKEFHKKWKILKKYLNK